MKAYMKNELNMFFVQFLLHQQQITIALWGQDECAAMTISQGLEGFQLVYEGDTILSLGAN